MREDRLAIGLSALAILACFAAGVLIYRTPLMSGGRRPSVAEVAEMIGVPLIASVVACWAAWRTRPFVLSIAAALVGLFSFVTGFSIGRAFWPALALLVWAALASFANRPDRQAS